jgi:hypothetical protein
MSLFAECIWTDLWYRSKEDDFDSIESIREFDLYLRRSETTSAFWERTFGYQPATRLDNQSHATKMPARYQSTNERQDSLPTEQDLFDDSTGVLPTVGVSKELPVKERLIQRLGKMLAAQLHLQEGKKGDSIDIFLSRDKIPAQPRLQLDEELQKTVRRMEDELKRIASNPRSMCFLLTSCIFRC